MEFNISATSRTGSCSDCATEDTSGAAISEGPGDRDSLINRHIAAMTTGCSGRIDPGATGHLEFRCGNDNIAGIARTPKSSERITENAAWAIALSGSQ